MSSNSNKNQSKPVCLPIIPLASSRVLLPNFVAKLQLSTSHSMQLIRDLFDSSSSSLEMVEFGLVPIVSQDMRSDASFKTSDGTFFQLPIERNSNSANYLNGIGCLVKVVISSAIEESIEFSQQSGSLEDWNVKRYVLTVESLERFKLKNIRQNSPYILADVEMLPDLDMDAESFSEERRLMTGQLALLTSQILKSFSSRILLPSNSQYIIRNSPFLPGKICDLLANLLMASSARILISYEEGLELLNCVDQWERVMKVQNLVEKLYSKRSGSSGFIKPGLKKPLIGGKDSGLLSSSGLEEDDDMAQIRERIDKANLPDTVLKIAQSQFKRLEKMNPINPEHSVIRTYLDWICDLPWDVHTNDVLDIEKASEQLERDHYGLKQVKKRILEYLAVRKLTNSLKGPILCFVGAPGVGKTSMGKSIADALGRKFHRLALGGVRDVAEMKGHRRTYIGALPGLFIQAYKAVGVNNPVILLDEIDKLGRDPIRGDPTAALLEILDPEQNFNFVDHYMGVPFDLSKTVFIATANSVHTIPPALLDRMELINLSGYSYQEKVIISRNHLLPKQIKAHGLVKKPPVDMVVESDSSKSKLHSKLTFDPIMKMEDDALMFLAQSYTREPGVRNLERQIAAVCRYVAADIVKRNSDKATYVITEAEVEKILGPPRFHKEIAQRTGVPGVVCGLSYMSSGSGALLFIETSCYPGKNRLILTGSLGDVIKESATMAFSWIRANQARIKISSKYLKDPQSKDISPSMDEDFGVSLDFNDKEKHQVSGLMKDLDFHIHFPSGAIPKDGPSAGITITTALVSLLTECPVKQGLAMTGEMTLSGKVLPVGGIPEKLVAAHRGGVKQVIIPERNRTELVASDHIDVQDVKRELSISSVNSIDDVLRLAFEVAVISKKSELLLWKSPPLPASDSPKTSSTTHSSVDLLEAKL